MKALHSTLITLSVTFVLNGCSKLLDVPPPDGQLTGDQVYSNDQTAAEAVTGIYIKMMESNGILNGFMTKYPGLCADELRRAISAALDSAFYNNNLPTNEKNVWAIWKDGYTIINLANTAIENLERSTSVSSPLKEQLTGQAKFLRALTYFYLANLWSDIPLVLTNDFTESSKIPRTPIQRVYLQIVEDLTSAQRLLPVTYPGAESMPNRRITASRSAASALLARVYLYNEDWVQAETVADSVIASRMYQLSPDLQTVFTPASPEVILQFIPVQKEYNTAEGSFFLLPTASGNPVYELSEILLNAFEAGDKRLVAWTKSGGTGRSPYKQKVFKATPYQEYNVVLRYAEVLLIRSEARVNLGKLEAAKQDLNTIRHRAGLPPLGTNLTKEEVLKAMEQERRIELFAEWGHRWFDLKRWGSLIHPGDPTQKRADDIMPVSKPGWQGNRKLWPIPQIEIGRNGNLTQNEGYLP